MYYSYLIYLKIRAAKMPADFRNALFSIYICKYLECILKYCFNNLIAKQKEKITFAH